ncbi:MAG: acetyl-CoA C-acetyltransferase, partial [Hyphomicrobiaceae bacterium]
MADQTLRRIAIVGGSRIPFCRSNTLYSDLSNLQMMTTALQGLVDKYDLGGQIIDEVVGGAVVTHSRDWNLAREAVNGTTLHPNTPGVTMMQACGTSLQAAMGIGAKIATGQIECGIACGSDTTSDAPIVFSKKFSQRLIEIQKSKGTGAKLSQLKGFSPGELAPQPPSTNEPRTGLSMGQHCELMAQKWRIPRAEQDKLAFDSHVKAEEAYNDGFMDDLIVPCNGVYKDNNIRDDINLGKLSELRTVFERSERGTLTAANSTPLTDGASAVLLASQEWAAERGLPVLAHMTYAQHAAIDYLSGRGLLMAPTIAVAKMLDRAGLALQDFDFYEIHEAFAAQVLCTLKAWEDPEFCKEVLGRDKPLG